MLALAFALAVAGSGVGQQSTPPPSQTSQPSPAQTTPQTSPPAAPLTPQEIQEQKEHDADVKRDIAVGKRYMEDTEKQYKLCTDKEMQARVQRVGAVIASIANSGPVTALWGDKRFSKFDYIYKVLQGDDVNAFSLPGGHIYVFEGLMKVVESDDELAGVLGHETAHAAFRHVATLQHDQQQMMNISLPAILAAILLGRGTGAGVAIPGIQLLGQAQLSGWSVKAEQAADYGGFQFLLKSHYNPSGMLSFMERLASEERLGPNIDWGIYRDHPPGKERAEALMHEMADRGITLHRSQVTTSYRVTAHTADKGLVELDFGQKPIVAFAGPDALSRASDATIALNNFFDATPDMFELQEGTEGTLVWHGSPLLVLNRYDAEAVGMSLPALREKTLQNMRFGLFNLGFHVWASHG